VGKRIIIVEDNPADAKTLRVALLRRDGEIETIVIEDGARAIDYFSGSAVNADLVLLDLNLPIVSGFEILEFLKSDPQLRKLPVVVLSGSSSQQEIERCYAAGANSYLCKPTGIQEVFDMAAGLVTYWFGHARLPRSFVATHG
jgi:chemotaxis family two-component system response regulator Rcp1